MKEEKKPSPTEDPDFYLPGGYTLESVRSSLPPRSDLSDDFEREIEQAVEEEANRIIQRFEHP